MRKVVNFCDYFVICTASSDRRIRGLAENIKEELNKIGVSIFHLQGLEDGNWVLVDMGEVVVHIFSESVREFYGLEHLWQDAKKVSWKK